MEKIQAMHEFLKNFMETKFASYLCLSGLDLVGLRHLCRDANVVENPSEGRSLTVGPSSNPPDNLEASQDLCTRGGGMSWSAGVGCVRPRCPLNFQIVEVVS